jgi:hypothetical protein
MRLAISDEAKERLVHLGIQVLPKPYDIDGLLALIQTRLRA